MPQQATANGPASDPCATFQVKTALKGAGRDTGAPDARLPITPDMLKKLIAALPMICSSPYEMIMFKCGFCPCIFWSTSDR